MLAIERVKSRLAMMHRLVREVLVEGIHYGLIPGTQSKNLLKPGAEEIFKAFQCTEAYPSVETVALDRENRYALISVVCEAVHVESGLVVARGIGAADTTKWLTKEDGSPTKLDFGWLYNAALKIAKKRAHVGCALSLGAVSGQFTQDMEDADFPQEPREGILAECPLHPGNAWRAGKFGQYHGIRGGGFCNLNDILKDTWGKACKEQGIEPGFAATWVKTKYGRPWSKLNEIEQGEVVQATLEGALVPQEAPQSAQEGPQEAAGAPIPGEPLEEEPAGRV